MKGLTIEQKAEAYDKAIKRAKELLEIGLKDTKDKRVVLSFFPELAESEDKKMIQYFKDLAPFDNADELYEKYGFCHKDAIAWLENRGEQKPAEWSEEDEQLYNDLSDTYFYNDEDYPEETYKLMLKRVLDWMTKRAKSLRPQSQWKPDSSMLICLEYAIKHINKDGDKRILSKLLEQLKKLREE